MTEMADDNLLQLRFPSLGTALPRVALASLPTPVRQATIEHDGVNGPIWVKCDDQTSKLYGGNKIRKLEYLFGRLPSARFKAVATYGTVASNHALATALHGSRLGYRPVCFLAHQTRTPLARRALLCHAHVGSEMLPWGGAYADRLKVQREHLWGRDAGAIPMGGSSWTGCVGFINAGLELAAQVQQGLPLPGRIYLATGTMGSTAGLALGLALARLPIDVHAVRVSPDSIATEDGLDRLVRKVVFMLHRCDPSFPAELHRQTRVVWRHDYFGPGYAKSTPATDAAIRSAKRVELVLEPTYTGKAMAALLDDFCNCRRAGIRQLFWNTYHSAPLPAGDRARVPATFRRYLD